MSRDQWSRGVELHEGALERLGWHMDAPAETRHRAIDRSVREVGYARTMDRLDFMRNVANRGDNRRLHEVAEEDAHWLERWEAGDRGDEDRRRELGDRHRVRGFDRDIDGKRERVRPHMARNPRRRP